MITDINFSLQLKMPQSVGTKKSKAVEQLLDELGVGKNVFEYHVLRCLSTT